MRLQRLPASLAAALVLATVATIAPSGPVPIDAAFAAAPEGRLIVFWKERAPDDLPGPGIRGVHHSKATNRRSVVVAADGEASRVAARLLRDQRVATVVPDAIGHAVDWPIDAPPNDLKYADYQADLRLIGMPAAWQATIGSPDVVVAVLDSGYTPAHKDLEGTPIVHPYNARTGATVVEGLVDVRRHGTHVAGTIVARAHNERGIAGMAPGVTLMPITVIDDQGGGRWSDFLEGVDWARVHGADVINMSFGGPLTAAQVAAFQPVYDAAWNAGVLSVAAAGNNDNSNAFYPASMQRVLSVSATDNADQRAWFSTYNAMVDVAAPGVLTMSTLAEGGYGAWSGTSMAAPHVSALAALVKSVHPEFTVAELEEAIVSTAVDLYEPGRDDRTGWGRIDAAAAVAWTPLDVIPPSATVLHPTVAATGVAESVSPVVELSEPVTGISEATVTLATSTGATVPATVVLDALTNRVTVDPTALLASRTTYRVAFQAGIADLAGNVLPPVDFSFTTGDTIAPKVTRTRPFAGATGVSRSDNLKVWLSESVNGVGRTTVKLKNLRYGWTVAIEVRYDSATRSVVIDPNARLTARTEYRLKLRDGIRDVGGNALAPWSFTFRTGG